MAALENVFSWSKSRDEQFREYQRKYYFDKYLSWGGWDARSPTRTRQAYIFKNLKNRWAWKGESVHHLVEEVLKSLRSEKAWTLDEALTRLTETMRANYRSSRAKKYLEDPKRSLGLFEHEYEKPVSDATWKAIHDESAACIRNLFDSRFFKELAKDDKKNWLLIEDLEEFDFEGSKIYVKLDFARQKDGVIEIYDWKTGKDDAAAASIQIGAYAVYAMGRWKVPLEKIRAYLFNLSKPNPEAQSQVLTEGLILETQKVIRESISGMRGLLVDPAKNRPKPEEEFGFTTSEKLCNYCTFYKICPKWSQA